MSKSKIFQKNYHRFIENDYDNLLNLHPRETILACLKILGWSYRKYSRLLGKREEYFNNRVNNDNSKRIGFDDLITFRNVIAQSYPKINFGELVKSALILKGSSIINPERVISYYENIIEEKDHRIKELEQK